MSHRLNNGNSALLSIYIAVRISLPTYSEFCQFINRQHHKSDQNYSDCQLKFRLGFAVYYSKYIAIVLFVNIQFKFIRQIVK